MKKTRRCLYVTQLPLSLKNNKKKKKIREALFACQLFPLEVCQFALIHLIFSSDKTIKACIVLNIRGFGNDDILNENIISMKTIYGLFFIGCTV